MPELATAPSPTKRRYIPTNRWEITGEQLLKSMVRAGQQSVRDSTCCTPDSPRHKNLEDSVSRQTDRLSLQYRETASQFSFSLQLLPTFLTELLPGQVVAQKLRGPPRATIAVPDDGTLTNM